MDTELAPLMAASRLLVIGAPETGTPALVERLARRAVEAGRTCAVITADPGLPLFGPPGAASLGEWQPSGWRLLAVEGISTLDAARFRVPLLLAVERLLGRCRADGLLVHGPGLFRGMAAAELLPALVRIARLDAVAVLGREVELDAVRSDLEATGATLHRIPCEPRSRTATHPARVGRRSEAWAEWLRDAAAVTLDLERVGVAGAPPPLDARHAWAGRQTTVLDAEGATVTLGEIIALEGASVHLRVPHLAVDQARTLVVRDARRDSEGRLATARVAPAADPPDPSSGHEPIPLPDPPHPHATRLRGVLQHGLLGDSLLSLHSIETGRVVLVDLGAAAGLPARLAHRTSAVLLTHGHMDHSEGLVWLLRYRIAQPGSCRVVGPKGTADRLAALIAGFTWDRVGDHAPRFEVVELDGDALRRSEVVPGRAAPVPLETAAAGDGVVLRAQEAEVRAIQLDHGIPVLAYALTEPTRLSVRADRLEAAGLAPGPWLAELQRRVLAAESGTELTLPDGRCVGVGELADEMLFARPGQRLVYATDVADTPANRKALVDLARGAQLLVLEAAFASSHADRAASTGHLTARACGEIATAAGVGRLLPFHLSSRYQERPEEVLAEVAATCDRLWLPEPWRARIDPGE
jgi:ribonuclease BN (tRNA processing enzyme)